MILAKNRHEKTDVTWQNAFLKILPQIEKCLGLAFSRLDAEAREDAIEEAVIHTMLTFTRLFEQGRTDAVSASTLSWYAALAVKRGRPAGGRMSNREPLSRYAQLGQGIRVERLHAYSAKRDEWIDIVVEDKRATIPDRVAAKMDVGAWLATLSQRTKRIAQDLAFGFATSEVAKKYGVTPSRISQLRRTLEKSWAEFQHESVPA